MADIDIERRPKANILPWLICLAILVVVVGWLLWRNNQIPEVEGRRDTIPAPAATQPREVALSQELSEGLPIASEPMGSVDAIEVELVTREPA